MILFRRKKEEKVEEEPSEIAFSELEQWITKRMDAMFEDKKPYAEQFKAKFHFIINSLQNLSERISQVQIKEEQVAPQYLPVINDAKTTVRSAIEKETAEQLPEINTFDDLLALRDRAKGLLNRLGEMGGSRRRILHSFFGRHVKVLKAELEMLDKEVKKLNELIDEHINKTSVLSECRQRVERISYVMNEKGGYAEKLKVSEEELESLRSGEEELVRKIGELKKTPEFNAYLKDKEELMKMNGNINELLYDVNMSFSRISRPVNKYTYEVGLDKESNYLLQSIMENPVNLMDDTKVDKVAEALNKVREGMEKGRITTKNPEKDIENINTLIGNLHDYVRLYKDYNAATAELRGKTSGIDKKLETMRDELQNIRDAIQQKESYLKDYSKSINSAKSTIDDELRKISEGLERATGSKVKIVL